MDVTDTEFGTQNPRSLVVYLKDTQHRIFSQNTNSQLLPWVIELDNFQTNVISISTRYEKWFTETSQIITVTSLIYNILSLSLGAELIFCFFENWSSKISAGMSDWYIMAVLLLELFLANTQLPSQFRTLSSHMCARAHTHILLFSHCAAIFFFFLFLFENQSNKITASTSDWFLMFFPCTYTDCSW